MAGRLIVTAGALIALCTSAPFTPSFAAQAAEPQQRISFQIATGSSTGSYFPVGALLSEVLSHPPGVAHCESVNACGPAGLIVSTMASQGSVSNVISVNAGMISSGLAQADVVSSAMEGRDRSARQDQRGACESSPISLAKTCIWWRRQARRSRMWATCGGSVCRSLRKDPEPSLRHGPFSLHTG